jgi:hypothetical protein
MLVFAFYFIYDFVSIRSAQFAFLSYLGNPLKELDIVTNTCLQ